MNSPTPSDPGLHDDLDIDSGVAMIPARPRRLQDTAQARLLELAEDGKSELAKSFDGLVTLANELAARVESTGSQAMADYAWQAAGILGDIQKSLRDRPVDALLEDGRALIRREPALAVGVAVAAGFVAARLFKSGGR